MNFKSKFFHVIYENIFPVIDRVRITSVTIYDFIYANTKHLYTDVASNEDIWRDAKVVDVDMESPDMILSFI